MIMVIANNPRGKLNRIYAAVSLAVIVVCIANIISYNAANPSLNFQHMIGAANADFGDDHQSKANTFFSDKLETLSGVLFAALILLFFLVFTSKGSSLLRRKDLFLFLPVPYAIFMCIRAIFFNPESLGFVTVSWGYMPIYRLWEYVATFWIVIVFIFVAIMCFRYYQKATTVREKIQMKLICIALAIPVSVTILTQVVPALVPQMPRLITSGIDTVMMCIIIAYSMLRYQLMELSPSVASERILDTMADYLVVLNSSGKVSFASTSAIKMLEFEDGFKDKTFKELFEINTPIENLPKRLEGRVIVDEELTVKTKSGKTIPVLMNASAIKDEYGEPIGYMIILKDMTQISRLIENLHETNEQLIASNEKLKELDKLKDMFISISAHELKTPLTSIKGFTQLLQDEEIIKDEALRNHYINLIAKNSETLYNLVLDVVDSSRLSLGKLSINSDTISVQDVFSEIKENMEIIIRNNPNVNPVFTMEYNLPKIIADKNRLMQVLRNIIINATHFTEKGEISLNVKRSGEFIQFEIKDTGKGIPKNYQKNIFSKFYQAESDANTVSASHGSGLGLSISKGLVELMGGKIWFESQEGKGTTFYFTMPIVK